MVFDLVRFPSFCDFASDICEPPDLLHVLDQVFKPCISWICLLFANFNESIASNYLQVMILLSTASVASHIQLEKKKKANSSSIQNYLILFANFDDNW